jgi:molybdopterin biosynthesis enzyme
MHSYIDSVAVFAGSGNKQVQPQVSPSYHLIVTGQELVLPHEVSIKNLSTKLLSKLLNDARVMQTGLSLLTDKWKGGLLALDTL